MQTSAVADNMAVGHHDIATQASSVIPRLAWLAPFPPSGSPENVFL